ncbi:MAG: hypothetical protein DRP56_09640 [Planctomycetota bacterium]|nr:MAG: hypothetical protein DRP56_09640 [Planctomycetota bacterium]
MSNSVNIMAVVEGTTEQFFIRDILAPYLWPKEIFITPVIVTKPGQKGGDVKFSRVKNDIEKYLKQRRDTYLTLFIDYYGIKSDWPGLSEAKLKNNPEEKAEQINQATLGEIEELWPRCRPAMRFIPYIAMHEFEALLFSNSTILAQKLNVQTSCVDSILNECGGPENIDDSPQTAPSKRLESLSPRFKKTTTGIAIAKEIGVPAIRGRCPIFNEWLTKLESLA